MAHELSTRSNGFTEMAYIGEKPWHGLGQELTSGASIEDWTTAAGMDWKVQRAKVRYPVSADGAAAMEYRTDDSNHVLFRSDTKDLLAIVSDRFQIVQPAQTLEFFRDLVSDAGYQLCTAGVLQGGKKFWAQATAGLRDNVLGNDVIEGKLLMATACDGSMKTIVKEVSERVVCANTLAIAMAEGSKRLVKVSHRSVFDPTAIKAELGIAVTNFEHFISGARKLAKAKIGPDDADKFLLELLFPAMKIEEQTAEQLMAARGNTGYSKIKSLFDGAAKGYDLPGFKGTAWGLVNATTEYFDHHRGNKETTRDNRLNYSWFGDGDKVKSAAFAKALDMVA